MGWDGFVGVVREGFCLRIGLGLGLLGACGITGMNSSSSGIDASSDIGLGAARAF